VNKNQVGGVCPHTSCTGKRFSKIRLSTITSGQHNGMVKNRLDVSKYHLLPSRGMVGAAYGKAICDCTTCDETVDAMNAGISTATILSILPNLW